MNNAPISSIDPFDTAFLSDPYAHHEALRETGPLLWLESVGCFGMARHADVQAALKDPQTFCSSRGVGIADLAEKAPWRQPSLLLETDPPLHDRARALMNRVVSPRAVRGLRESWAAEAETMVDRLVTQGSFDAATELGEAFPLQVFPDAIGMRPDGRENLLQYAAAVFNTLGPRNALFEESVVAGAAPAAWVAESCKREKLQPGGWGMALYEAADRGECSHGEAELLVRSFLSAGVDTTVNGLSHLMLAFASFPEEWQKLRANPELCRQAFEESLRWDTTVQMFFRTVARDIEIHGITLPEGAKVLLFLGSANRDPRRWQEPNRFDISRALADHVGFGAGIHQCVGQMVARLEGEVVLSAFVKRVKSIELAGPPVRRLNNSMHAMANLPVQVQRG